MASEKEQRKRLAALVVAAIGVVAGSVVTTLYAAGSLGRESAKQDHKSVTFTDAALACQNKAQQKFKDVVANISLDDHSSRFEAGASQYRMFLKVQIPTSGGAEEERHYFISCYVNSFGGQIVHYEQLKQKDVPTEPIKKGGSGGLFGWPR